MVERSLSMREVRGSMPLSSIFLIFCLDKSEVSAKIIPANRKIIHFATQPHHKIGMIRNVKPFIACRTKNRLTILKFI